MSRFAAVFVLGCLSAAAAQRDYWLRIERKGTPFAWEHITVTDLADGNVRYDYSHEIRIGMSGTSGRQEKSSYVVDRQLRPISFTSWRKQDTTETLMSGERAGKIMRVTVRGKDVPEKRRSLDVRNVHFGSVLEDLIVRNAGRRRFRLRLLDTEELKVETSRVEIRSADGDTIEASVKEPQRTTFYRLSRDGRVREMSIESLGIRSYPAAPDDARNIVALKDSFFPPVKSRNRFPNPFNVTWARVQVKWKQLRFSDLRLGDNRQTLVKTARSGDAYEAVLNLSARSGITATTRPRRPAAMYLREDSHIKPRDPGIRKQAAEIIGKTKDPAAVVRELLTWVKGYIHFELRSEILTGPQVLEKQTGRCAEYAVLFASLARAAGIPTRIVIGVAYEDGVWAGHMWNEVWLGDWIAVDAALGGHVTGAMHLKLLDAPTVEGAMLVPRRMLEDLQVEILDFHEAGVNPALKTGISGSTYVNASFHCRISAPDASWGLKEQTVGGARLLSMKPKEGAAEFTLCLFGVPAGIEAEATLQARLEAIMKNVGQYQLLHKGETDVAQRKVPSATFSQTGEDGSVLVNHNSVLIDGNCGYLFVWNAPKNEFDRSSNALRSILASFELIP